MNEWLVKPSDWVKLSLQPKINLISQTKKSVTVYSQWSGLVKYYRHWVKKKRDNNSSFQNKAVFFFYYFKIHIIFREYQFPSASLNWGLVLGAKPHGQKLFVHSGLRMWSLKIFQNQWRHLMKMVNFYLVFHFPSICYVFWDQQYNLISAYSCLLSDFKHQRNMKY